MLSKDFTEFVALLNKHDAEYMIVGDYSVGVHGYPRYTGDLDIWLNPTQANAERVLAVIAEFGFASLGLTVEDLTKEGNVIQFGQPPLRIDLLTTIDGVAFDSCFANRKEVSFDGLSMNFIGYHDLVTNKKATGRHRDLDDVENMSPDAA
jgi:predicted nucleotidyltransferase